MLLYALRNTVRCVDGWDRFSFVIPVGDVENEATGAINYYNSCRGCSYRDVGNYRFIISRGARRRVAEYSKPWKGSLDGGTIDTKIVE